MNIYTLGIESSCDETAVAVVKNGREILANIINTQIPIHQKFGGVVPEVASRNHIKDILPVYRLALSEAGIRGEDLTEIAATYGPGLVGSLLVGLSFGKALAYSLDKPFIAVNHLEGHIFSNFLTYPELEPPFLSLVVSGGHTSLVKVLGYNQFELLGETRDDAAGEAFDKIARTMGLGYPGGPKIDALAKEGNPNAIDFPEALKNQGYEFSFSGLKSAVLNYLNEMQMKGIEVNQADVAASFQKTVVTILTNKTLKAAENLGMQKIVLAGGVAANSSLEASLRTAAENSGYEFYFPSLKLCTDNAAMIACRGYYMARSGLRSPLTTNAVPS